MFWSYPRRRVYWWLRGIVRILLGFLGKASPNSKSATILSGPGTITPLVVRFHPDHGHRTTTTQRIRLGIVYATSPQRW